MQMQQRINRQPACGQRAAMPARVARRAIRRVASRIYAIVQSTNGVEEEGEVDPLTGLVSVWDGERERESTPYGAASGWDWRL